MTAYVSLPVGMLALLAAVACGYAANPLNQKFRTQARVNEGCNRPAMDFFIPKWESSD